MSYYSQGTVNRCQNHVENLSLITNNDSFNQSLIFGIKIQGNSRIDFDHIYCLYLLLLKYGEPKNQQKMIEYIKRWKEQIKYEKKKQQDHKCMVFLESQLSQSIRKNYQKYKKNNNNQQENYIIHSIEERNIIKRAMNIISQWKVSQQKGQGQLQNYLIDIPSLVNRLLNITCQVKNYFHFSIIQIQQFDQRDLNSFIQINKKDKTATYFKRMCNKSVGLVKQTSLNSNTTPTTKISKKKFQDLKINLYNLQDSSDIQKNSLKSSYQQFGKYEQQQDIDQNQQRNIDEFILRLKSQNNLISGNPNIKKKGSYDHEKPGMLYSLTKYVSLNDQFKEQDEQQSQAKKFVSSRMIQCQYQTRKNQISS